jgi:hypothetical protein
MEAEVGVALALGTSVLVAVVGRWIEDRAFIDMTRNPGLAQAFIHHLLKALRGEGGGFLTGLMDTTAILGHQTPREPADGKSMDPTRIWTAL